MKSLPIDSVILTDPLFSQRNPYQTFLLIVCVISSWPLLQGESGSATIERELSEPAVIMWGVGLLIGSLLALLGEFWRGRDWTGLLIERAGLSLVGTFAFIYTTIVWTATDSSRADVAFVAGLTAAWGGACFWRCGQITRRLRWMRNLRLEYGGKG